MYKPKKYIIKIKEKGQGPVLIFDEKNRTLKIIIYDKI